MGLEKWSQLTPHQPTLAEIRQLFAVVDRDLGDAGQDVSPDTRFKLAYDAALRLCTIALHAEGYKVLKSSGHHATVINSLPLTIGPEHQKTTQYLSLCSTARHHVVYEEVGLVSKKDAEELRQAAHQLRHEVLGWLRKRHPQLVPADVA